MKRASVAEAKAHLSALIKRAEGGEEVVVTRSGTPVVKFVPAKPGRKRSFSNDEGLGFVSEDFDAPLPTEILKQFYV